MLLLLLLVSLLGLTPSVDAVTLDVSGMKFGINGFMDLEYTYSGKMAMVMTDSNGVETIMSMDESSSFDQHHMNLLLGVEKGKFRAHLNIQSLYAYTTEDGGKGDFAIEEAYGEYTVNDLLKIRAGHFLMPFGIYNDIHYITPLFATVVLPYIYEPPMMYAGGPLIHESANLLLSGTYVGDEMELSYGLHVGNGERDESGLDKNKDKQLGGRVRLSLFDNFKVGVSYCTVEDDPDTEGRNNIYGVDIDATFLDSLNLQSEYVRDDYEKRESRYSYYVRLTYNLDRLSPFITYDYFEDKEDLLYKKGMNRWGVGVGYTLNENITLKGEYHYHVFSESDGLPDDTDKSHMVHTSLIFVF